FCDDNNVFCSTFSYPLHSTLVNGELSVSDINFDTSSLTRGVKSVSVSSFSSNGDESCKLDIERCVIKTTYERLQEETREDPTKNRFLPEKLTRVGKENRSNCDRFSINKDKKCILKTPSNLTKESLEFDEVEFERLDPEEYKLIFGNPAESSQN